MFGVAVQAHDAGDLDIEAGLRDLAAGAMAMDSPISIATGQRPLSRRRWSTMRPWSSTTTAEAAGTSELAVGASGRRRSPAAHGRPSPLFSLRRIGCLGVIMADRFAVGPDALEVAREPGEHPGRARAAAGGAAAPGAGGGVQVWGHEHLVVETEDRAVQRRVLIAQVAPSQASGGSNARRLLPIRATRVIGSCSSSSRCRTKIRVRVAAIPIRTWQPAAHLAFNTSINCGCC